jgi:beta-fructofuranosidase
MHWGHAVSDDLIKWEHLPVALAPDSEFDKDGCFSGTALILDGKLYLMYTGVHDGKQEQCIAFSTDGLKFEKYAGNPVIGEKNLAPDVNINDFRDPKIIKRGENFYCIIGANSKAVVYKSKDMYEWEYTGDLLDKKLGDMWECPDYFEESGETVFIASVCGANQENKDINKFIFSANPTYFMLDSNNLENLPVKYKYFDELENGFDFYAPQVLQSPENKNIIIAWMYTFGAKIMTDSDNLNHGWANCMTLPREISVRNGRLCQAPIRAVEKYRQNESIGKDLKFSSKMSAVYLTESAHDSSKIMICPAEDAQNKIGGKCCEIIISADISDAKKFTVILPEATLEFDKAHNFIIFNGRKTRKIQFDFANIINLRIFIDVSALEIFINEGEKIISSRIYPEDMIYKIEFKSDGCTTIKEIIRYDLFN